MMQQHYVIFFNPGTFVAETTEKPIEEWSVDKAVAMAGEVTERYAARPYGFCFTTRAREDGELDSKETARSGLYFLGGTIETLEEIEARDDPKEETLRLNMRYNDLARIVRNNNSWRWVQPLREGDVVLDVKLPALAETET